MFDTRSRTASQFFRWMTGQVPMVFFTPFHISSSGFLFGTLAGHSMRSPDMQQLPFFNHMRIVIGMVILVEPDYLIQTKQSCWGHHHILQNVLILKAILVNFCRMEHSSPFMGDHTPTVKRHMTTASESQQILRVVNTLSMVCKL